MITKTELEKLLESYELTQLDHKVVETWGGKTWAPRALRDAARSYAGSNKQTASLLLWAVYIMDFYGLFREMSRKSRENFLEDFD